MAAQTDTDAEVFRLSSLVGHAGVGSNGEKLVNTLLDHYPEELQAAQLKRVNDSLDSEIDDDALERVAKIAGVKQVEQARVRGGQSRGDEAVVTYAYFDDRGEVWKGCFPYEDLAGGKSDRHVSQRESLAKSAAAEEHRQNAPLREQAQAEEVDPFALLDANASQLVALMEANPDRAEQIKSLESIRSQPRKSVMEWEPDEGDGSDDGSGDDS